MFFSVAADTFFSMAADPLAFSFPSSPHLSDHFIVHVRVSIDYPFFRTLPYHQGRIRIRVVTPPGAQQHASARRFHNTRFQRASPRPASAVMAAIKGVSRDLISGRRRHSTNKLRPAHDMRCAACAHRRRRAEDVLRVDEKYR
ncbi:hypothetical protein EVAR_40456_1 [Eumeta japonica]|uniref:Uncharacterized protein n=1 Tax=Eumeta variegata TaxID=151549 RepID=A0A4C1X2F2_EUMVA|nr:hypothetical protein EVAR_40456_1 [Eumeta japonica]